MPGPARAWTYASGAAELALSGGLIARRTRRRAGLIAAVFFVVVFPANIKMSMDTFANDGASTKDNVIAIVRLPLQIPLVLWALYVYRRSPR